MPRKRKTHAHKKAASPNYTPAQVAALKASGRDPRKRHAEKTVDALTAMPLEQVPRVRTVRVQDVTSDDDASREARRSGAPVAAVVSPLAPCYADISEEGRDGLERYMEVYCEAVPAHVATFGERFHHDTEPGLRPPNPAYDDLLRIDAAIGALAARLAVEAVTDMRTTCTRAQLVSADWAGRMIYHKAPA